MRYLGNKTRLIPFLSRAIDRYVSEPGVACDPFSGTASVASALKRAGWRVHAGDLMAFSYALQVVRVQLDHTPRFKADVLPPADRNGFRSTSYGRLVEHLETLPGEDGFLTEHYTLAGDDGKAHGRMYFTAENARRIDAVRRRIDDWQSSGLVNQTRAQLLIATLLEAADRVANTTGVYASFVKTLQTVFGGLEAVDVGADELKAALLKGGSPCTLEQVRERFDTFIDERVGSRNRKKVRIRIQ